MGLIGQFGGDSFTAGLEKEAQLLCGNRIFFPCAVGVQLLCADPISHRTALDTAQGGGSDPAGVPGAFAAAEAHLTGLRL